MKKLVALILVFLFAVPAYAQEYDFNSMTLSEVKQLAEAASDYYDDMTTVDSDASSEIEDLITEEVGEYLGGDVSVPLFGFTIYRERDVYTMEETVKVRDSAGNTTKHNVEATFLNNGQIAFTKLIVDGDLLISLSGEDIPEREYLKVTAKKLIDDLDKNSLTAKETYLDQYVEVSGLLETIDSSGKYISVTPDKYSFSSIHCTIKSKDILEKIKKMSSGSKITVYGKITDIGEFLGYTMTIQDVK